jgi:hypothetical protein
VSAVERQHQFLQAAARLILHAAESGFQATGGDLYRDARCPYGSKSSKHKRRLAIDLNLFHAGVYLTATESYRALGDWWESQGGIWGGHWDDGNHFEWPDAPP